MRQAALFNSGLMIVIGSESSQIGPAHNLVELPTQALKEMFSNLADVTDNGVMTVKSLTTRSGKLEVGRHKLGYFVGLDDGAVGFFLNIDRSDADDLRELIFGKYSSASGFWWPPEPIAEVLAETVAEPA